MIKKFMLLLINFYMTRISPKLPPRCRYYPTCSSYAKTAITRFGALKGGWLTLRRLLRCNRLFKGGLDYVPEKFKFF